MKQENFYWVEISKHDTSGRTIEMISFETDFNDTEELFASIEEVLVFQWTLFQTAPTQRTVQVGWRFIDPDELIEVSVFVYPSQPLTLKEVVKNTLADMVQSKTVIFNEESFLIASNKYRHSYSTIEVLNFLKEHNPLDTNDSVSV